MLTMEKSNLRQQASHWRASKQIRHDSQDCWNENIQFQESIHHGTRMQDEEMSRQWLPPLRMEDTKGVMRHNARATDDLRVRWTTQMVINRNPRQTWACYSGIASRKRALGLEFWMKGALPFFWVRYDTIRRKRHTRVGEGFFFCITGEVVTFMVLCRLQKIRLPSWYISSSFVSFLLKINRERRAVRSWMSVERPRIADESSFF